MAVGWETPAEDTDYVRFVRHSPFAVGKKIRQMDPRLRELRKQQQREMSALFDQFRAANPYLPIHIDGVDSWPGTKDEEYDAFTAALRAEHAAQREALAVILDSE